MDLGFATTNWSQNALRGKGSDACRLEWHGLRARLFAVRAARHMMEEQAFRADIFTGGSFDQESALLIATYNDNLCPVNPTALANGNAEESIDACVAGANLSGDRG